MLRYITNRDYRALAKIAVKQGWTIETTKSNHLRWKAPTGSIYVSAMSPSDHRSVKNLRAALLRAGLILANRV